MHIYSYFELTNNINNDIFWSEGDFTVQWGSLRQKHVVNRVVWQVP